jgi:hypothetical protein
MSKLARGGWLEFWIGLIVFSLFFAYMGNIVHEHHKVEIQDKALGLDYTKKDVE